MILGCFIGSRLLYLSMVFAIPALSSHARQFKKPWAVFLRRALFNADGGWYSSIAVHGYDHVPFTAARQHNWPFFPLYPYLTRWLSQLSGLSILWVGYGVSSLAFLGSLFVLARWAGRHLDPDTTRLVIMIAAFSPLTPYFVAYRDTSLLLFLATASLEAMDRARWGRGVAWGALASVTHPSGILLALPFVVGLLLHEPSARRRFRWGAAAPLFGTGFVIVAIIDRLATGNPFAFLQSQRAWQRTAAVPFVTEVHHALAVHKLTATIAIASALFVSVVGLGVAAFMARNRAWWPGAAYLAITILLANTSTSYEAIPRFIAVVPALYLGAGLVAQRLRWQYGLLATTVGLLGLYSSLWILGVKGVQA